MRAFPKVLQEKSLQSSCRENAPECLFLIPYQGFHILTFKIALSVLSRIFFQSDIPVGCKKFISLQSLSI